MADFFYGNLGRLLGIEKVTGTQWKIGSAFPPTLLAAILIGGLVFAFWSYRREEVSRYKSLLVGLRFSGLVILLLVLLQPAFFPS